MRSKLGTRARLAAHLAALVLLILMLVYLDSPKRPGLDWESLRRIRPAGEATPTDPAATLDRLAGRGRGGAVPEESLRPPEPVAPVAAAQPAPIPAPAPEPEPVPEAIPEPAPVPAPEPEPAPAPAPAPEATAEATPEAEPEPAPAPEPEATPVPAPEPEPSPIPEPVLVPEAEAAPAPAPVPEAAAEATPEAEPAPVPESAPAPAPALPQPDESGAIVVAAAGPAGTASVQAATPLPNANLELLAGDVYWLAPGRDLAQELAAVPELGGLILLTPLPGYRAEGFEHIRTTAIPADITDLTADAAEQFLHAARSGPRPVVAAALPGSRGAAFFKGAYLILERGMTPADALAEVEPELEDAGRDRDEIAHRLSSLVPPAF